MKITRDQKPEIWFNTLKSCYFGESRYPGVDLFNGSSRTRAGQQLLENWLPFMRYCKFEWNTKPNPVSND